MNIATILTVSLVLMAFLPALSAEAAEEPVQLSALVQQAIANNPEVRAGQARWQMFRNRARQAGALDDPMLMLKLQNYLLRNPFNSRRDPMTQRVIGVSQQLPFWGKRALKEEIAESEAESYRWQLEERKLELARMVKESYYRLFLVDRELEIVERNLRIMADFIDLAETKYSVGQGVQQDVFKAQVERSKMLDMRISLQQQRTSLLATINMLLSRPSETPVGEIPDFDIRPAPWTAEQLRALARDNRPLIRGLQSLALKGEAGQRLAAKEFFPDATLTLEYMQRDRIDEMEAGYDMYSLGLTFNLPLQRERRHAMVRESLAETGMARAELDGLMNEIGRGIADNLAQMERSEKLAQLYKEGIIPQAEQSLESAAIGYRVNKVDFLTLLDSRLTLYSYERQYYETLAEYQMRKAQLEALVGAELE